MNATNEQPKTVYTLEQISQQKAAKLEEIRASRQRLNDTTRKIFRPAQEAVGGANTFMSNVHSGMAIFNGVITGFKIIRQLRALFYRRR